MNRLKDLLRSFTVLNLFLAGLVLLTAGLVLFLYFGTDIGAPASGNAETVKVPAIPGLSGAEGPEIQNFAVVAEKNLFHPERRIPPQIKEEALQKPDVILYGTLITDSVKIAYVEDKKSPYSTPGRGPRQQTLKQGDKLSGYTLQEVEADRITLVKGDDRIVIRLESPDKRKSGEASAKPATGRPTPDRPPPPPSVMPMAPAAPSPAARTPMIIRNPRGTVQPAPPGSP